MLENMKVKYRLCNIYFYFSIHSVCHPLQTYKNIFSLKTFSRNLLGSTVFDVRAHNWETTFAKCIESGQISLSFLLF